MPVYVPPHVPAQPEIDNPPININPVEPTEPVIVNPEDNKFTLRYEPANSLNPILARNRDNLSITSLIYEPLFALNDNLVARPILCDTWSTEDNITFTFTILPDIPMHDGSILNADDVAYSLRQAKATGRHRAKLSNMSSVTSDGELTVTVTLNEANARFIRLLDIPIIKNNSIEEDMPPGTGPYIFPYINNLRLTRFINHRNYANMPLSTIYLQVCNDSDLTELFDQGGISLLWDDPSSTFEVRINRDHEPRFFNTSTLQYLGFNAQTIALSNPDVRRAIGCAVDRQAIVETIMNNPRPGQAVAAPVAISPGFSMYNEAWEPVSDPLREMGALLDQAMIADYNQDGYLERSDGINGPGIPFPMTFIVNVENSYKVSAAENIAGNLRQVGFDVDVRVLTWSDYMKALEEGNFDIYYGEVQIGADFDLSPLLIPGENSLNYGKTASTAYSAPLRNFLAAASRDDVNIAGKELCDAVNQNAPFIPILYKRYAIYTPVGVVSGATPSQSGVFYNFEDWQIDMSILS